MTSTLNPITLLLFSISLTFSVYSNELQNFPSSPHLYSAQALRRSPNRLGKPLIGDDGIIYACSQKFLYAFRSNGSMAWNVHLNYTCNGNISPVYGGKRKVYIIAENRVLGINYFLSIGASAPSVEIFPGNESAEQGSEEIIGLSASLLTSSVYINVRNKGLSAYTLGGKLRWSALPLLNQSGYHQGCQKNVSDCYFSSTPIIDHCEASIYISTNQGELYSISTRRPHFNWIQDLSSFDREFTVTPGNNGRLFITLPTKALILGLDSTTGDVLWQTSIGPLSSSEHLPAIDSNGWVSIGSLDGFLYSVSPMGIPKKFSKASPKESVVQVSPVLDCSGYGVYISQTVMEGKSSQMIGDYIFVSAMKPKYVVFWLLVPATGSFYWSQVYPGQFSSNFSGSDLQNFLLDEEMVLAFIAAAEIGNPLACRSTRQKLAFSCSDMRPKSLNVYTGNERTILLFLLFETVMLVILAISVRFCCIFWSKQKLQNQDLGKFLEKRRSLWIKKKEFDQTISELEHKATEETTTNDVLEKLSSLVKERRGLQRKLSTTYSLGRDTSSSLPTKSVLPLYNDGKTRSYSFRGASRENVTIFHTLSGSSADDEISSSSQESELEQDVSKEIELAKKAKQKGKGKVTVGFSDEEDDGMEEFYAGFSSETSSGSIDEQMKLRIDDDHAESGSRKTWLKRRRSLS